MDQEELSNSRKKIVDGVASTLLSIDESKTRRIASRASQLLEELRPSLGSLRVVVCGGAGSNKTTLSELLSTDLGEPTYDLDMYVPGGWTQNRREYERRLEAAWEKLWDDLSLGGWIVDHVESCNPRFVEMFRPSIAVHLDPGIEHLRSVAQVRDLVGEDSKGQRYVRALDSAVRAKMQFQSLPGEVIHRGDGWEMKALK